MESKLEFVAVDFPHANRFTIHILAAVAEYESRLISERMKQVIAARRERGAKVGHFAGGLPKLSAGLSRGKRRCNASSLGEPCARLSAACLESHR